MCIFRVIWPYRSSRAAVVCPKLRMCPALFALQANKTANLNWSVAKRRSFVSLVMGCQSDFVLISWGVFMGMTVLSGTDPINSLHVISNLIFLYASFSGHVPNSWLKTKQIVLLWLLPRCYSIRMRTALSLSLLFDVASSEKNVIKCESYLLLLKCS